MKKKTNRLLSILLCCVMLIGLLPTAAFAWTAPTLSGDGGGTWNIQLSAEGVLSWNEQQSATSYTIEVDETAMGVTVTKIENISGTSYNLINRFKELKIENGTYYFQIKANGPDTTSDTISFKYISPQDKLSAPLNLHWDGTVAKWNSVANATGYTVYLYTDDGYLQLTKTATTTQYDWESEATDGRWFEVVATADNYRDSNAAEGPRYGNYSWTAPTLSGNCAAWNVQLSNDGVLSWADQSATSYDIEVDETAMGGTVTNITGINTTSYNLIDRFKELKIENGTYYFTIKANGQGTNSGTISFRYVSPESKLSAPQNLTWDGTVAKWDSVANATEYTVNLYRDSGSLQLSKTTTETQYDWSTEAEDGRWFEVIATANNYRDSNPAESPKYVVVSYSIGAYPYDATVSKTQAGGQVIMTTDAGAGEWSSDGYIKTATEGTTVTLNAMPATGYEFVEWRQGTAGAQISASASYEFQASEDKYLYAVFEAISTTEYQIELQVYDITYTANAGGTVKLETNKGSAEGENPKAYATKDTAVTITAVPAQGYEFVAWKKYTPFYDTAFSTEATYTFTAADTVVDPSGDPPLFLYAVFQEVQQVVPKYEINCVAHNLSDNATAGTVFVETDMGGTGYAASQQEHATANTTVTVRAVAEPGYQFVAWRKSTPTDANATVSTNAEFQFTATEAVWMYAVFEYTPECTIECIPFDITGGINNGQNNVGGTVSIHTDKGDVSGTVSQSLQATRNSSVTVNAVAASGYEFLGWKKASPYVQNFVATTASYTFDINEELYLYAVFQETPPAVGGFIDFLITDYNVCFAETDESGFMRVNLFGNGKVSKFPVVYRTDSLDLAFDGWYTAKEGGEKVTEDTVFNGYTILYDRWTASNIDSGKIINSITIPNSALVNGYTEIDYINASSAVSMDGVVNSKVYAVYNGLNAYGSQVTGAETIDTAKDYSVVTTVKLEDGYYFAPDISLTAQNGVRAGVTYRAIVDGVGVTTNTWNSLATTVDICINFPAGGNNVGFTTEPQGGVVEAGQQYNFTWAVSGAPTAAELQVKSGSEWAKVDNLTVGNENGTIAAQTGTKTYRIFVTYANGSIYSNTFTVTWFDANANAFSMSPTSGTVKNGTDYAFTWACVQTPATATLERKTGADWTNPEDLGTATSRTITYTDAYANSTQTFRIKATMATGDPFYSSEFTVTYKATPLFSVQPGNGKVAVGSTYTVNYTVQTSAGDGEFDTNNSVLQKKNGGNWENVSTPVYAAQTVVPAQNSATTETYRVGIKIGSNDLLYSDSFTVQWVDDYTFELDKDTLAWGTIAKADDYTEYSKMIKVMATGTKTGSMAYDTPVNFDAYYWDGPNYDALTFTPKNTLAAGSYNESVDVWVTTDGSDELEKKTITLSVTIEAPTYTISFNPGDGTGSMASVPNTTGTYELPACTFTAPNGKQFKAWSVGGYEYDPGASITVSGNTTVTALWKDILVVPTYTVSFEANGGTGTMADVNNVSGDYTLPACGFSAPSGQRFKNWSVGGVARAVGDTITINANTTVTAQWEAVATWTVQVSSGNVCGTVGSYNTTQYVEQGQAMTDIIITANDGYYFPDPLTGTLSSNGVTATRNSYTQVTISGIPTADVYIGFGPVAKSKELQPTSVEFVATGADTGNLTGLENGVSYSVTGAAAADFTASGTTHELTNVVPGTLNIVKKATDTNTKLDSDAHTYPVSKNNSVPNLNSTNCSDSNNNNGSIWYVTSEMEWQKSGDNSWTTGDGSNITGLTPGTYYVRYKANSINLAGNAQTINIAAYNVPTLTGTVEITGTAKYNEQLTATVTGSNNSGTLSYQWVRNTSNISGATGENYTLVEADVGNTIKVVVTSSVETGSITSDATAIVEKADGPVAPTGLTGVAPTTAGGSDGKITGTATTMEYSTDSSFTNPTGTICPDTETTGLTAGTYYVRVKETTTHKAGAYATVVVPAFVAPTYTVSFDANGGTGTMADVNNVSGDYTLPANGFTAPTGKQFKAWSVGGNEKAVGATINVTANTTVTAVWEDIPAPTYTVSFAANGGTGTMADVTGVSGEYTLPANGFTAPANKQFKAWSVGGNEKAVGDKITVTANTTVTAVWEDIPVTTYTITFNANGGSVTPASAETTAEGKLTSLPTPTRSGSYSFNGWYTAASGGTKVTTSTVFNADATIYAQWTYTGGGYYPTTYPITVEDAKNGDVSVSPKAAAKGNTVTVTVAPDKGYTLDILTVTDKSGKEIELTNKGDGKYTFKMPSSKVTVKATFADNSVCNGGDGCPGAKFHDVDVTLWYHEALDYVINNKLMNGYGNNYFGPNDCLTRGMMMQILYNLNDRPAVSGDMPFTDVSEDKYYADAIKWAESTGLVFGCGGGLFGPDDDITREQLAVILWRYAGSPTATQKELNFDDVGESSKWAMDALLWANENGVMNGNGNGILNPKGTATRAHVAQMLMNFLMNVL